MAMGLSSTAYEVVDLRPPAFGPWIESDAFVDALILDLENPKLAVAAVTNLRAHAKLAPVLLVSSDVPGWDAAEMRQLPAAEVLPLPINREALLAALEDLLVEPWASWQEPTPAPQPVPAPDDGTAGALGSTPALPTPDDTDGLAVLPPQHAEVTAALWELTRDSTALLSEEDDLDGRLPHVIGRVDNDEGHVVAAEPANPADAPEPAPPAGSTTADTDPSTWAATPPAAPAQVATTPVVPAEPTAAPSVLAAPGHLVDEPETSTLSAVPRTRRSTALPAATTRAAVRDMEALRPRARDHSRRDPDTRGVAPSESGRGTREAVPTDDAVRLVRELARVANRLYGVPETAEVVILDAVERTRADAGALLVPDEGTWRVAAGVNLRPLEHRYELDHESWLVQQVARAHRGAIVEDSDIARDQLQGAPLASWRHLLSAPVPEVEAVMLLARREDPPFDEQDMAVLAALGEEAGPLLSAAVDTRRLARTLWEFRDEIELPR